VPVPVPSEVLELVMVGFVEVLQQTPREVTIAPPSLDTFPPHDAVVVVMAEIAVVDSTGAVIGVAVVNVTSDP